MTAENTSHISEAVQQRFVGRVEALGAFHLCFSSRHSRNGVYYCGDGGLGKTWILKKILLDEANDTVRTVTDIVDFLDTQNHTILGLQATIESRLQAPQAFKPYDEIIEHLKTAQQQGEATDASVVASLEARANQSFIECCQQAIIGREVVLLFDTFECVQQREAGKWMLRFFLPQVLGLIVVIAGRPVPEAAQMPDNIITHPLEGLSVQEVGDYTYKRRNIPEITLNDIKTIQRCTGGAPLLIDLILDLSQPYRENYIAELDLQEDGVRIHDLPSLQEGLVGQFEDRKKRRNQLIWIMSYLRRRFDINMLAYIVESDVFKSGELFLSGSYDEIFADLCKSLYVKEYPERQSHLLHDEIQRMVAQSILTRVDPKGELWEPLYDLIVDQYYSSIINDAETEDPETGHPRNLELAQQFRAEQFGYILDKDYRKGIEGYKTYRDEIERTHRYDFEELLWGEMRDHLKQFEDSSYKICHNRGQWLRKHSLFSRAVDHYRQMLGWFPDQRIDSEQALGFMLLRQGEIDEAINMFEASTLNCSTEHCVSDDDFDQVARIENNLGQAYRQAGRWNEAFEHYNRSFRAASKAKNLSRLVSVYINRGYMYSLQGYYSTARQQCERAISLLEPLSDNPDDIQHAIFAWMNLGTTYRHAGNHARAFECYNKSKQIAESHNNREAICSVLQHLGINDHLRGRILRRQGEDLHIACGHQIQAFRYLTEALKMAWESGWQNAAADGLNRLAKVYREIEWLHQAIFALDASSGPPEAFVNLMAEANRYQMPFEVKYRYDLFNDKLFSELNWLEKSARLFEVSALIASEIRDSHRALDSWTELTRLFILLEQYDQVQLVMRWIEYTEGGDYQQDLFTAMNNITEGDLDFKQGRYEAALDKYGSAYARIAEQSGYASYFLTDRIRDLEWRLQELPPQMALDWCDALEQTWEMRSIYNLRPDMLDLIERVRLKILGLHKT